MQSAGIRQSRWGWLLSVLIAVRAGCAVVVFGSLILNLRLLAACVFAAACVTDLLDGQIAKRTGVSPSLGTYADASADFLLVLGAFSAFVVNGLYPVWTMIVIILMFLQFVLTSGRRGPLYDPVGKYYGAFLFGAVGITLVFAHPAVRKAVLVGLVLCTLASAVSRSLALSRLHKMAGPRQ